MILEIKEVCLHDGGEDLRIVEYEIGENDGLYEGLKSYMDDFDSDKIISCNDMFEGDCHDSEIVEATIINSRKVDKEEVYYY